MGSIYFALNLRPWEQCCIYQGWMASGSMVYRVVISTRIDRNDPIMSSNTRTINRATTPRDCWLSVVGRGARHLGSGRKCRVVSAMQVGVQVRERDTTHRRDLSARARETESRADQRERARARARARRRLSSYGGDTYSSMLALTPDLARASIVLEDGGGGLLAVGGTGVSDLAPDARLRPRDDAISLVDGREPFRDPTTDRDDTGRDRFECALSPARDRVRPEIGRAIGVTGRSGSSPVFSRLVGVSD